MLKTNQFSGVVHEPKRGTSYYFYGEANRSYVFVRAPYKVTAEKNSNVVLDSISLFEMVDTILRH